MNVHLYFWRQSWFTYSGESAAGQADCPARLDLIRPEGLGGDELPAPWQYVMKNFNEIMDEDHVNLAPTQRSMESPALRGIPINYQERRIWNFNEQIDRTIRMDRIPEHLRVPRLLAPSTEHGNG